jgi:hypothetical protein
VVARVEEAAEQGQLPRGLPAREVGVMVLGTLLALVRFGELASTVDRAWSVILRLVGK